MAEPTWCCALSGGYCARVDTLFGQVQRDRLLGNRRPESVNLGLRLRTRLGPN
jgi:hypothetical protein